MSDPFNMVCSRLEAFHLRMHGPDRGRACCPGHGGSNRSALSVGRGANGAVLLRCWQGCEVESIANGLGLEMHDLFPPREAQGRPIKRSRLLSAHQALDLLNDEANFAAVTARAIARGVVLTDVDRERALVAANRIDYLRREVMS